MSYPAALKKYKELCINRPDLLKAMTDAIGQHVKALNAVRSDQAGSKILPRHQEFADFCGAKSAQVFGIAMREHLKGQGWAKTPVREKGKRYNYYNR